MLARVSKGAADSNQTSSGPAESAPY